MGGRAMPTIRWVFCVFLAACGGPADQRVVEWREADRLFIADGRNGIVRVFDTRNGPVPCGQLHARLRASVRDMQLDAAAGQLWVLGDDALYRYDAWLLTLVDRRALPADETWQRLEAAEAAAVTLVSAGSRRWRLSAGNG